MNLIANASIPPFGVPVFGASNKFVESGMAGGWWMPRSAGSKVAILRPLAEPEKPVAAEPPASQALDFVAADRGELWRAGKPSKMRLANCAGAVGDEGSATRSRIIQITCAL
jgi:hypothetical protein